MIFKKYIRFFKDQDWDTLLPFIKKHTHEKYILSDKKYFNWQFTSPFLSVKTPSVLVLEYREKILGYLGVIPLTLNYFDREVRGACLANLMTDYSLRNKGAGVSFIEKAQEEGFDVLYTTGYIPPLDKMYDHLGWKTEFLLRRFLFVIDSGKVSDLAGEHVVASVPTQKGIHISKQAFSFEKVETIPHEIDSLWSLLKSKYPVTVVRSHAYITWRYVKNPFLTYHIFIGKKDNRMASIIIIRIEKTAEHTVARIVDFVATDESEEDTFLHAIAFCKKQRAHLIDFFFTGNFHVTSLLKTGFKECHEEPYSRIPIRFNPVDTKVMHINFAFKTPFPLRDSSCDDWYVTKGDGDQDRFNPQ